MTTAECLVDIFDLDRPQYDKLPRQFKITLAEYCLKSGCDDSYELIITEIAPDCILHQSITDLALEHPLLSVLKRIHNSSQSFIQCKKILHDNCGILVNEIIECEKRKEFMISALMLELKKFGFNGETCAAIIERLWHQDFEDNRYRIEDVIRTALGNYPVDSILSAVGNSEIKAVIQEINSAIKTSSVQKKQKPATRTESTLTVLMSKIGLDHFNQPSPEEKKEIKAAISSSPSRQQEDIKRLLTSGTRKAFYEAWEFLKKSNFRYDYLCCELIEKWGQHFPVKLLEREIKNNNEQVILPALISKNPLALRYLNAVADDIPFNKKLGDGIVRFCERYYLTISKPESNDNPDISNIVKLIADNYQDSKRPWFSRILQIIAGDEEVVDISNLRLLLGHIPEHLWHKFTDALIDDKPFTRKVFEVFADYFQDLIYRDNPGLLYTYPIAFLKKLCESLEVPSEDVIFHRQPLWTVLAVHLWIHRQCEKPSLNKMLPPVELENLPNCGLGYSLLSSPSFLPDSTPENEDFLSWLGIPKYPEAVKNVPMENRLSLRLRKYMESASMADVCNRAEIKVPLNLAYTKHIVKEMVASFSKCPNKSIFAEYRSLLKLVRTANAKSMLKNRLINNAEFEKIKSLADSEECIYGLPVKMIINCFEEKKEEKVLNDILAQIEAPFVREIFAKSIFWVLTHKESVLFENAPWTGMRIYSKSFSDRPSVWAKELVHLLDMNWDTTTLLRLCFALGHLREPLGGIVPIALSAAAKAQSDPRISAIIKRQKDLFNRENFNRGHYRKPESRVADCRKEIIKAQNSLFPPRITLY